MAFSRRFSAATILLPILALLIVMPEAFAQGRSIPLVGVPMAANWWQMAGAALLIGAAFVAISFMGGEFFGLPEAKSQAKQEAYELAVSILLIAIVMGCMIAWGQIAGDISESALSEATAQKGVVAGICEENEGIYNISAASLASHPENRLYAAADFFLGCAPNFAGSPGTTRTAQGLENELAAREANYDPSVQKSQYEVLFRPTKGGILLAEMMNRYTGLLTLEMMLGTLSTLGTSAYLPEAIITSFSVSISPNAGLGLISEATIQLTDLIGVGVGSLVLQKILLVFIHESLLFIFLPFGIGLRGVPFLRKTGSTIVAVCLVLYFIYPLTIWINSQIYFSVQDRLIKWTDYSSLLEICVNNNLNDPAQYKEDVRKGIQEWANQGEKISKDMQSEGGGSVTLPYSLGKSLLISMKDNSEAVGNYLISPGWALGPVIPANQFFEAMVEIMSTAMQIFVLNALFIVNSIVICVTVFRDVSLAIGGEPRIFGISKLV